MTAKKKPLSKAARKLISEKVKKSWIKRRQRNAGKGAHNDEEIQIHATYLATLIQAHCARHRLSSQHVGRRLVKLLSSIPESGAED